MIKTVQLTTPLDDKILETLKIGDKVLISGKIYTARDAAHKRLYELIKNGEELPFDMTGQIIYYTGPAPTPPGKSIGSAGPTTSYRMDKYTLSLLTLGLKATIGKGQRSEEVINSMIRNKAVYFVAIGGAAVVIAKAIKQSKIIAYDELGTEAIRELEVENFPCFVANDIDGNDIFMTEVKKYQK
ncbi:MAG: Fe-S-containing hydro-lyase [Candidatus Cloacimonetes bacterium]|nr:Fe-S-containing hydro-lyase [Candidatus Cloacimonadota bacterium]